MHPTQAETPSPAIVFETLMAHQKTAALVAAIELDIFRAVGEGPADAAIMAKRCSASERGIRILCDFLTIMGLLQKSDGVYSHTLNSSLFLDPRSPACMASTARFMGNPMMREPYEHLAEIVRSGRTSLPGEGSVSPDNPVWVEFARSMAPMMGPTKGPLAKVLLGGRTDEMRVLDIAAGHGLFGIEVALQNPQARITALDWAAVLEVALENAQKAGVEARFETLAGSAFDVDFGGTYDGVLLTNFLHHFDPDVCIDLMKKVRACLKPGGRAAILEFVPNDDKVSPPTAAGFSLVMLASTERGDAYTFRELDAICRKAGFTKLEQHPLPPGAQTAVIAEG